MKTVALIVAAGRGMRAGGDVPKQYVMLTGVSVLARAVDAFSRWPVFVVIGEGQRALFDAAIGDRQVSGVMIGGAERQHSVAAGLEAIAAAGGADQVFIHDAARPLLPVGVRDALVAALDGADGAVPVLAVADTLARGGTTLGEAVDRAALVRVQTPQAFRFEPIRAAYAAWTGPPATDDAQIARAAGLSVTMVPGSPMLDKITTSADFAMAEARLSAAMISRSAMGFDVHRLEAGQDLWLCGVHIPHSHGLSGHSDADVALHALTDALLGTIGAGDIGVHFPPSEPQWRGASSDQFLTHARDLIAQAGGRIDHVDVTIICEAPRIGPHVHAMRERLSTLLALQPSSISIKATTTERLGLTGRGEGIAAQAIATVRVPEGL